MVSVIILKYERDVSTDVTCMYIRWDWETTLARLRPLLSVTGVAGDPVLPELCLLVRTRPGQHRSEGGQPALILKLNQHVYLGRRSCLKRQTDEDLDEGGW